ncbi:MAG: carboxypeptidase-like regulatory domain-containing protein [Gemmatimonadales bacterium]
MNTRTRIACALAAWLAAGGLDAQTVRGIVTLPDSSRAAGVIVVASDAKGTVAARALTGESGGYELRLPGAGRYEVRVLRIGFRPTVVPAFEIGAGESRTMPVVLRGEAIVLSAIRVQGQNVCRVRQDSGQAVARLWEEARKAITATQLSQTGPRLTVKWTMYERNTDMTGTQVLTNSTNSYSAAAMRAFVSLPPDSLAKVGYMSEDDSGTVYRAPDAEALLSDAFASLHCFRAEPPARDKGDWVGIGFRPAKDRADLVDIEGTLWLDRTSFELRQLEFRYTNLPLDYSHVKAGGSVEFLRLSTGSWLVSRWQLRMPRASRKLVQHYSVDLRGRDEYQTVVEGLQLTGGEVTAVTRGVEVLFSSGESTHDYSPALLVEDANLASSCGADSARGDKLALLRGTVFEGEHKGIANAAVRLTWRGEFKVAGHDTYYTYSYENEQRDLTADAAGNWYLCGVPRERVITVRATAGRRTSALVTVRIPRDRGVAGVDVEVPPP